MKSLLIINFFFALLLSIKSLPEGMDQPVVVDLRVMTNQKASQSCPVGYEPASGCPELRGCDLNKKAGGDYVYLCQKKLLFKELGVKDKPLSKVDVILNSKNCGTLKLLPEDLNSDNSSSETVHICMGQDSSDPSPITDIFVNIKNYNTVPSGYNCINRNTNKGTRSEAAFVYICYKKDKNFPKSVKYENFVFDYEKKRVQNLKLSDNMEIIRNNNGNYNQPSNIQRDVMIYEENTYSWNFEHIYQFNPGDSLIVKVIKALTDVDLDLDLEVEFRYQEEGITIEKKNYTYNFKCNAEARQYVVCSLVHEQYQIEIPYSVDVTYTYFDETSEQETINSSFAGVAYSKIKVSSCCVSGCKNNLDLCEKGDNPFLAGCPTAIGIGNKTKIPDDLKLELNFDKEVIVDLTAVTSSKEYASCPPLYEVINSGCPHEGCDLNDEAGGDYVYLCQKKKKFKDLELGELPINDFQILFNTNECGDLKLLNVDLNERAGGTVDIFLCYGNSPKKQLAPIVDFFVYIIGVNEAPKDYLCDMKSDINDYAGGRDIYLCYKRDESIPKNIVIKDFNMDFQNMIMGNIAEPNIIDEITVESGSGDLRRKFEKEFIEEKNIHFFKKVPSFLQLSLSGIAKSLFYILIGLKEYESYSYKWKTFKERKESTEINCISQFGKTMKCIAYNIEYRANIPYNTKVSFVDYKDDVLLDKDYSGTYELKSVTDIYYKSCCIKGCCTGNKNIDSDLPQCANSEKDISCDDIMSCFSDKQTHENPEANIINNTNTNNNTNNNNSNNNTNDNADDEFIRYKSGSKGININLINYIILSIIAFIL